MHIARDKQIDVSVFAVIRPGRARAKSACRYASLVGHIFKLAGAQIVITRIAAVTGDIDIRQAVIVMIGGSDSHSPALAVEGGDLRDVTEFEISFLMVT